MMRLIRVLGMVGLCLVAPGCRLASDITHNLVFETCLFADEVRGKIYYASLARSAWSDYRKVYPDQAESCDFARGFKAGFADYLESGGDCGAPPLPPFRYWKTRYETPEGRAASQRWFAGFKEGVAFAKASGYRELVVVPVNNLDPSTSGPSLSPNPLPSGGASGVRGQPGEILPPVPPPGEELHSPKPVAPPTGLLPEAAPGPPERP